MTTPAPLTPPTVPATAAAGRRAWAALEPMHNLLYFDRTGERHYATAGIPDRRLNYFAARASPLGEVGADLVSALFYNFNPLTVGSAIPLVWSMASPEAVVTARFEVADLCLRPLLGDTIDSPELHEALELARTAAEAAARMSHGRPLFAAHAAQPWPDLPHVQLWWAQTLLREFRGDGHQSVLLMAGLSGPEALIMYTATEKVDGDALRLTRGWSSQVWRDAADGLREQGLLTSDEPFEPTQAGRTLREWIENSTDILARPAYEVLGTEGCERLAELSIRLNQPVVAADVIPWLKRRKTISRRDRVRAVANRAS